MITVSYKPIVAGAQTINVTIGGVLVGTTVMAVNVVAGDIDETTSFVRRCCPARVRVRAVTTIRTAVRS